MRSNVVPLTMRALVPGSHCYGQENLPLDHGAILACNHFSAIDPLLIGSLSRRTIWYMTKQELAQNRILAALFNWAGGFPVKRDMVDRQAIQTARWLVRTDHVVGVFVEGTRQAEPRPAPAIRFGASYISAREHVPIIPCGVDSYGWSLRNRRSCCVVFGAPIWLSPTASPRAYRDTALTVAAEIQRLWELAVDASATGFPSELEDGSSRQSWPRRSDFHRLSECRVARASDARTIASMTRNPRPG
jgi:1-acyl-sn-glycerol-3-phosphate acyltransferase